MSEFANEGGILAARFTGAVAGAGVSLIYLLPQTHREAASRFLTGLACGMIFGGPVGLWIIKRLEITEGLSGQDIMLTGSAAASLCAWWGLGVMARVAERYAGRPKP
ncbi:DUF6107 family protein [Agrobacterium sp. fls2-241-TYG-188a]|jgi:hypothetical protein|uniref:DUF6107 family protein n=1 Tax=Agrobacterium sp. fls2-241-TYG-188a TaxID=3040275 RepID=UPI000DD6B7CB|nr:DUF6107 family protein [Agrobacterium sp. fls2-241-TYG-188a]